MLAGYSVRVGTEDDLDALVLLEKQLQKAPWTRAHFQEEMAKPFSETWVITDDETDTKIAAYLVFWGINDESYLLTIGVAPEFKKQGLATHLMEKLINEARRRNYRRVLLEVRKSNESAIRLYQRKNMTVSQIRKGFYSDGEDAYVYELLLGEQSIIF